MSEEIVTLIDKYGQGCLFEIGRKGATRDDTKYSILFEKKLEQKQLDELEKIKLYDLTSGRSVKDEEEVQEEIPF